MRLYCCGCLTEVEARLTDGKEIYPHRRDLAGLPFWRCDVCRNYVGCHHKTEDRTKPLGCIPTPELKRARNHIHRILDPLWRRGIMKRADLYSRVARSLGRDEYHTADIRTIDEARTVYRAVVQIAKNRKAGASVDD